MTTYNTGNPIGSTAVQDLYDNAQNLDELVNNKTKRSREDRFGVPRKTWWGIEQDFQDFLISSGYVNIGDYGASLNITARNQVFWRAGEIYRAGAALELPYTTTGNWGDEGELFVTVGDQVLRQQLADPDEGAELVGYQPATGPATNVSAQLLSDTARMNDLQDDIDLAKGEIVRTMTGKNLSPRVVDLHFGTLKGTGWLGNGVEIGGEPTPTTVSDNVAAGALRIPVASNSQFRALQLICYQATNGLWYSATVDQLGTNAITVSKGIPVGIASGAPITYFYANDAHPNSYGYTTIVDDALRQLGAREEREFISYGYEFWENLANGSVTGAVLPGGANGYRFPGSSAVRLRSAKVDVPTIGDGARSQYVALSGGEYVTRVALNSGERTGGFTGSVSIGISELTASGSSFVIATTTEGHWDGVRVAELRYRVAQGSSVAVVVTCASGGPATFYLGQVSHNKIVETASTINHGKHVLLGDSWFANGIMMSHFQARLPNATFINAGVSGNRASQLIDRFDTDVAPHNPDYVWLMVGTNDYYSVAQNLFQQQINQLASMTRAIGAQLLAFNPSVGDATYVPTGEKLTISRDYAMLTNYHAASTVANGPGVSFRTAALSAFQYSIAAGTSAAIMATPGNTETAAFIRVINCSQPSAVIRVGYSSVIDGTTLSDEVSFTGGLIYENIPLHRSDTSRKFVVVVATNGTGGPISVSAVADIAWVQR